MRGIWHRFRNIVEVQKKFGSRPVPDEALCAVLWEYKDRGKKGYDLTERLFGILREHLSEFTMIGPSELEGTYFWVRFSLATQNQTARLTL